MSPYRIKFFTKDTIKKIKHYVKRILITIIVLFFLFLCLNRIFPLPDRIEYSTIITDDKGEVIHAFLTNDQQWRMKT